MTDAWIDYAVEHLVNPDQDTLRRLAVEHTPAFLATAFGNYNKVSRNKSRQAAYTYIITDEPEGWSHKTIARTDAQKLIDAQAAYIREAGQLVEVQGYLGVGPRAVAVQYLYTIEGANIAGMQQILSFPREDVEEDPTGPFAARFRVVYTPDHFPDVPGGQRILVDLANRVTYVMGPDYFGESKKGALRMLCDDAFEQGALVLHAGAKEVHLRNGERVTVAILGLSGTGKTTTTFSKQGLGVRPVQDDMVTLWPSGELSITENGCFAKTFGLTEESEPVIFRGTCDPTAWLENAYQDESGVVDFFKVELAPSEVAFHRETLELTGADPDNIEQFVSGSVGLDTVLDENGVPEDGWDFTVWTGNGRSIIPMSAIEDAADFHDLPPVKSMGVLNRDEGEGAITPGLVRFTSPAQAAGYFMLGETSKTSAAGKERGKTRSPFTQPFFPRAHGNQAQRFAELLETTPDLVTWRMNTGCVGGDARTVKQGQGFKVKIRHSSAMLEALFADSVVWEIDPDFGYEVVAVDDPANADLVAKVPVEILRPERYYAAQGKLDLYREEVARLSADREAFLRKHGVDEAIIDAVLNR